MSVAYRKGLRDNGCAGLWHSGKDAGETEGGRLESN